jgi:NADPH:quinone reductase-like Zn-dependent oxidoreductase
VTTTRNMALVRSIGADHVIDYTRDTFTRGTQRYDLVLDVAGTRRLSAMRRALTPTGRVVMVAPQPGQWIGPVVRVLGAIITTRLGSKPARAFLAQVNKDDLLALKELIEAGKVTPGDRPHLPVRPDPGGDPLHGVRRRAGQGGHRRLRARLTDSGGVATLTDR